MVPIRITPVGRLLDNGDRLLLPISKALLACYDCLQNCGFHVDNFESRIFHRPYLIIILFIYIYLLYRKYQHDEPLPEYIIR